MKERIAIDSTAFHNYSILSIKFYAGYYQAHSVSQTVPEYIAKYH